MLVPMETELPCLLEPGDEYRDFGPIPIEVNIAGTHFKGSYSWLACASCIECYMDWETRLEIDGDYYEDRIDLDLGIRHMGHNIQETYLSLSVPKEGNPGKEPRIACMSPSDCQEVRFERIE